MVYPDRDKLCGHVEVDETYVGGSETDGKRGRGCERKDIVVIALEVHFPKGFGRVMHWTVRGANSIIALRCSILSNRWEDFWEHRAAA